jgi:hypothetical protein
MVGSSVPVFYVPIAVFTLKVLLVYGYNTKRKNDPGASPLPNVWKKAGFTNKQYGATSGTTIKEYFAQTLFEQNVVAPPDRHKFV